MSITGAKLRRGILRGTAVLALVTVVGCTAQFRNHGFAPDDAQLAEVLIGVDTRDTVAELIGAPTAGGVLNDGGFYYVQSRWRQFAYMAPAEIEREVVAITFDSAGVVENIERYGLEDGQVVALSRRVTQDNVRDTTFIRQLLGDIGRFDAGTFLGDG
ncbi:MAG: lipo-like protein [Thalassobium sp.]|uniref:outer membrane protein assembly factor BamE n=1 Tax=Octadecabacter sp. SW4 TaxID=2602067 RepID=UPI000C0EF9DA|nr:outer membrane protein assembly factor BamE [Octadecabacter sp. SW4]PHQ79512.1 MAG: lipo-like protein [Thalassobium sp.]QEE35812.1 outer membrane protein assembly factor BamE [Octadecabacter sp. SW4]